jgi:hypothetical protein
MNDDDLIAILRKEEQAAQDWQDSELSAARQEALDYYDRKPFGDEQEGQSKVVTSELADTVESLMPSLMRVFASGEEVVEFTPMHPGEEQAAREASRYVPHVLMRENDGFRILYWFFKDALMYRLSAMTVDLEEKEEAKTDPVAHWTAEQLAAAELLAREVGASEVSIEVEADPQDVDSAASEAAPQTFSGTITIKRRRKRVVPDNIAPEDFLCSPGCRDIDQASFAGYRREVTASDLRLLGMSQEDIDTLSSDRTQTPESWQRDPSAEVDHRRKDSERKFWVVVAYLRADDNGDGISEMLRVVYAHGGGAAGRVIERMEWREGEAPIVAGSPILMSHTLVGRSIHDQVKDLQDVDTALTRGMLDNLYLTNRPRPAISERVNINNVLDWTPGMPIQVRGGDNPAAHISWLQVPSVIGPAQAALEYFATVRENRTGITRYNQGLDADSLNKTASGVSMIMSAAQQRQELIARTFAETSIKRLMRLIYRAIKRAATGKVRYFDGDDWAECDPGRWPDDMHLVVNVALGTGNKQQELQNLMLIGAGQEKLLLAQGGPAGPMVRLEHIANTFRKLVEAAGFKASTQFVASPREIREAPPAPLPPPPPPAPEMVKIRADVEHNAARLALDSRKVEQDAFFRQQEIDIKRAGLSADNVRRESPNAVLDSETGAPVETRTSIGEGMKAQADAIDKLAAGFDQGMQAIAAAMMAEQELIRGPDNRVIGTRRKAMEKN